MQNEEEEEVADSLSRMHRRGPPSSQHYRHSRDAPGFKGGCSTHGMTTVHRGHGASQRGEENRGSLGMRRERVREGGPEGLGNRPSIVTRADRRAGKGPTATAEHAVDEPGGWVVEAGVGAAEGEGTSQGDGRVGDWGEQGAKRFRKARASRRQHCGPGVSQFAFDRQQRAFVSTAWSTYRPSSRG